MGTVYIQPGRAGSAIPGEEGDLMKPRKLRLAGAACVAAIAAAALAACGSGTTPAGTGGSPGTPSASTPAAAPSTPATAFNATDAAFAVGTLRLENQAQAMAGLVAGHSTSTQLRQVAAQLAGHESDNQRLRDLMQQWHQAAPAPYTPGTAPVTGMGPGTLSAGDWAEMTRQYGSDFNDHRLDAMIDNHEAEITLCQAELRTGASPQARALAQAVLTQRQAELARLQRWHDHDHDGEHG